MDTGVSAAGADDRYRPAVELAQRILEETLDRCARRLSLPADEPRSVIRERDLEAGHASTARDPGFTTGSPCAQSGHLSGSYVGSVIASSEWKGTSDAGSDMTRPT